MYKPKVFEPVIPTTRAERQLKRVREDEVYEDSNDIEVAMLEVDDEVAKKEIKMSFLDTIMLFSKKFHKPFRKLKWRKRLERIDEVATKIISCCIDKSEVTKNGIDYIVGNVEFAHEVLNIVNCIKDRLELKLQVDLKAIEYPDAMELPSDDEEDDMLYNQTTNSMEMAYRIMGEATGRGYERIRQKFNEINPDKLLPSVYILNKQLPIEVKGVELCISCDKDNDLVKEEVLLGIGDHDMIKNEEDAMAFFSQSKKNTDNQNNQNISGTTKIIGSKLDGNFGNYVNLMRHKHETKGLEIKDGEDLIVISSFDGAEAFKSQKNVASVISFSSSLVTPSMIHKQQIKGGSSFNICTWQQLMGKEDFKLMNTALTADYWNSRKGFVDGDVSVDTLPNSKVWVYDTHDAKMLYLLLQHSLWNRKHHPFLLCKCKRGDGLTSSDHSCELWDDVSYKNAWERSLKRFKHKESHKDGKGYNKKT